MELIQVNPGQSVIFGQTCSHDYSLLPGSTFSWWLIILCKGVCHHRVINWPLDNGDDGVPGMDGALSI